MKTATRIFVDFCIVVLLAVFMIFLLYFRTGSQGSGSGSFRDDRRWRSVLCASASGPPFCGKGARDS